MRLGDRRIERPVFVVGMERSGTSLLRSILNGSAELAVAPETHFVSRWLSRWGALDVSEPEVFERFWVTFSASDHFHKLRLDADAVASSLRQSGVRSWRDVHVGLLGAFAVAQGKNRLGEKVPAYFRHIDLLLEWYPDVRILYSIRDPRAVVASHRVLDETWARGSDYELCRKWRERAAGALRWAEHPQVHVVRYEDLVARADSTLEAICRFTGVAPTDGMMTRTSVARSDDPVDPGGVVANTQVDAWRERLSPRQADLVALATRPESTILGFDCTREVPVGARVRLAAEVLVFAARASWNRTRSAAGRTSR